MMVIPLDFRQVSGRRQKATSVIVDSRLGL